MSVVDRAKYVLAKAHLGEYIRNIRSQEPTPALLEECQQVWGAAPPALRRLDNVAHEVDYFFQRLRHIFRQDLEDEPARLALAERLRSQIQKRRDDQRR
jgi:hypothetical protein